jgi:hypothetical protein
MGQIALAPEKKRNAQHPFVISRIYFEKCKPEESPVRRIIRKQEHTAFSIKFAANSPRGTVKIEENAPGNGKGRGGKNTPKNTPKTTKATKNVVFPEGKPSRSLGLATFLQGL